MHLLHCIQYMTLLHSIHCNNYIAFLRNSLHCVHFIAFITLHCIHYFAFITSYSFYCPLGLGKSQTKTIRTYRWNITPRLCYEQAWTSLNRGWTGNKVSDLNLHECWIIEQIVHFSTFQNSGSWWILSNFTL